MINIQLPTKKGVGVYKTEGIVIKRNNWGERDKLLFIYSQDFGKILIKAKSLQKKEAKLKESLEPFNHLHLMMAHGRSIDTIVGAVIINSFPSLKSHLPLVAAAYYLSEIIDKLIVGPEKDERIWQLILKAFYFLNQNNLEPMKIKELLAKFEWHLLSYLGYQPISAKASYLDFIQNLSGQKIESFKFLQQII